MNPSPIALRGFKRLTHEAGIPFVNSLDQFDWSWPRQIDEALVRELFLLKFVRDRANVIFVGKNHCGKTHLATALGYHAWQQGTSVLYTTAIDALTRLAAAREANRLRHELRRYRKPGVLILDELGYPELNHAASLLFQLISERHESGALIITTYLDYKEWIEILADNVGITIASAILDRVLHNAHTVRIDADNYRPKDRRTEGNKESAPAPI